MPEQNNLPFDANRLAKRVVNTPDTVVPFDDSILRKRNPVIKVLLTWRGDADLDISAFMLDESGSLVREYGNIVFYNSERRWKTKKPIGSDEFNPLEGQPSIWIEEEQSGGFMNNDDWFFSTLPLSEDDSVIGSWDDQGDDEDAEINEEQLHIRLNKINGNRYRSIAIVASIHQRDKEPVKTFADISDPCVNIYDADTNQQDIEYLLNNDHLGDYECVIVGFVKYNSETHRWDYITADKAYDDLLTAINNHWNPVR